MLLPCNHDPNATKQIEPTKNLLLDLDKQHPRILRAHGLTPKDYHAKLVFRSAVESIRGSYAASSTPQRQGLVADVLEIMKQDGLLTDFKLSGRRERYDFEVLVSSRPKIMASIEVKGGEGNSVNISERPLWCNEFIVWCHLDDAIVNEPSHGAEAIIFGRIVNEMVNRNKHVDAVIFKDVRCNTPLRPCPKYGSKAPPTSLGVAPDIFLMPQAVPTLKNPTPPPHSMDSLRLPKRILAAHGVAPNDFDNHVWQVQVSVNSITTHAGRLSRETNVFHKGRLIETRRSAR